MVSHLENPWWRQPPSGAPPQEPLDKDEFVYHAELALDVARAAESSLEAAEVHLKRLVKEEELTLRVLNDEIEAVRTRGQAARHQVASLRATLHSEGITPKKGFEISTSSLIHDVDEQSNNPSSPQMIPAGADDSGPSMTSGREAVIRG